MFLGLVPPGLTMGLGVGSMMVAQPEFVVGGLVCGSCVRPGVLGSSLA